MRAAGVEELGELIVTGGGILVAELDHLLHVVGVKTQRRARVLQVLVEDLGVEDVGVTDASGGREQLDLHRTVIRQVDHLLRHDVFNGLGEQFRRELLAEIVDQLDPLGLVCGVVMTELITEHPHRLRQARLEARRVPGQLLGERSIGRDAENSGYPGVDRGAKGGFVRNASVGVVVVADLDRGEGKRHAATRRNVRNLDPCFEADGQPRVPGDRVCAFQKEDEP